jgi:hypothetical protein
MNTKHDNDEYLQYVKLWNKVAPLLEKERDERIRNSDTKAFIVMTSHIFSAQRHNLPIRLESGLVIQQLEFRKAVKPRSS